MRGALWNCGYQLRHSSLFARSIRLPRRTFSVYLHSRGRHDLGYPIRALSSHNEALHNLAPTDSLSDETIFALSTAPGRAAIAIVRISGPSCVEIYHALCPKKPLPKPRYASVRSLYSPGESSNDSILDRNALILYFPSPNTVTGEDVLELHIHGGPAIMKAVLQAITRCRSRKGVIRYAEPGEFTRRAFLNDRLDLTQVEALGDVLSAATEQQRKLSVRGTTGKLAKQYEAWRTQLLYARGELEALIDFSEDQHFDESSAELASSVAGQVEHLKMYIETHITNAMRGELLRSGISIALLGAPNAGKSSLLNRIVGREAAIVSREAGTTRDVVEVGIDLGGYLCRIGDMAGLRTNENASGHVEAIGIVEEEGIKRAKQRALESDVVVVVAQLEHTSDGLQLVLDPEVIETANKCFDKGSQVLVVINKVDLARSNDKVLAGMTIAIRKHLPFLKESSVFYTSCLDEETNGVQPFLSGLISTLQAMTSAVSSSDGDSDPSLWQESLGASERHRLLLQTCLEHLNDFLSQVDAGPNISEEDVDIVIAAESLRAAAACLAKITGSGEAGDVEEVLGVVFEKFCVGK